MKDVLHLIAFILIGILVSYLLRILLVTAPFTEMIELEQLIYKRDELVIDNLTLQKKIAELEEDLSKNKALLENDSDKKKMQADIAYYAALAGCTPLVGEGVIILVNDADRRKKAEDMNVLLVHDSTLSNIIGELRLAGAEAIAINDTRIIFGLSDIVCSGPTINIDNIDHAPPFVIRAIGDRYKLQRFVSAGESYTQGLKRFGLKVEINPCRQVKVDRYNGVSNYQYAEVKE